MLLIVEFAFECFEEGVYPVADPAKWDEQGSLSGA